MACVTDLRNERNMSTFISSLVPNTCVLYVGKHWSAVAFPRKRLLSLVPDTCEVTCPQRRLLCRNLNALTGIHFIFFLEWTPNNIKAGVATSLPRVEDDGCFSGKYNSVYRFLVF